MIEFRGGGKGPQDWKLKLFSGPDFCVENNINDFEHWLFWTEWPLSVQYNLFIFWNRRMYCLFSSVVIVIAISEYWNVVWLATTLLKRLLISIPCIGPQCVCAYAMHVSFLMWPEKKKLNNGTFRCNECRLNKVAAWQRFIFKTGLQGLREKLLTFLESILKFKWFPQVCCLRALM